MVNGENYTRNNLVEAEENTETHFDEESGKFYSYNPITGSSRWLPGLGNKPSDDIAALGAPGTSSSKGYHPSDKKPTPSRRDALDIDLETLRSKYSADKSASRGDWSVMVDEVSQQTVYFNFRTKEILSEKPKGWVSMISEDFEKYAS